MNSILENLKPKGCANMPKEIICNCTKEEFVYPEAYDEPFEEKRMSIEELESRYSEMCDSHDDCEFCKYNQADCRLNFGYSQGRADALDEVEKELFKHGYIYTEHAMDVWRSIKKQIKEHKEFGEWIKEHDAKVRADAIDECIEIVCRETHDGTLCDYLEELKEKNNE